MQVSGAGVRFRNIFPLHANALHKEMRMSGIGSIAGGYGTTISLADSATAKEGKKTAAAAYADRMAARRAGSDGTAQNAGTSAEVVQAALKKAVQELSEKEGGRITFTKIADYRKDLEKTFSQKVRDGLKEAGLPKDTVFTLSLSKEGSIQVQCDNEDSKAVIEEYLSKNRKLCEEFGYIQALGSVERADSLAAARGGFSLSKSRAEIQASAVEAFFSTSLKSGFSPSSLTAAFGLDDSAAFYSGVSALV